MELLTVKEASQILRISPKTLRLWIARGVIPYCQVGKKILIKRHDIEALIESSYRQVNIKDIVTEAINKILYNHKKI